MVEFLKNRNELNTLLDFTSHFINELNTLKIPIFNAPYSTVLLAYTPVPYLATSSVAPAPCSARTRPCLDVSGINSGAVGAGAVTLLLACAPLAPMGGTAHGDYSMVF